MTYRQQTTCTIRPRKDEMVPPRSVGRSGGTFNTVYLSISIQYNDFYFNDRFLLVNSSLQYAERIINVDRGTFTPLVFTTAGCCAPECSRFVKRLCALISSGDTKLYAKTMT